MKLHHLFITTANPEAAAARILSAGLDEGSPNVHPGQGTANRRFFFENLYLELLFSVEDSSTPAAGLERMRLRERCALTDSSWGRFGFASSDSGEVPFETWEYRPPYMPDGAALRIGTNSERLDEPMIFVVPSLPTKPTAGTSETLRRVTQVELGSSASASSSSALQRFLELELVTVSSDVDGMRITIDAGREGRQVDLHPTLPLHLRL
jgi:hypothetical protein